jgi:hypothetical protein
LGKYIQHGQERPAARQWPKGRWAEVLYFYSCEDRGNYKIQSAELAERISNPVPPPLEPSPAPHSSHTIASFKPLGGLTIRTVKENKPRREPGTSPYPIFHKARNTLAERMNVVPMIQTIKNLEVEIRDSENAAANTSWVNPAIQDIATDHTERWEAHMDSDDDESILPQAPRCA